MSLNSSAVAPQGAHPLPQPTSGVGGSGDASAPGPAAPSSDLDVNTDIYSKALVTAVYLALFAVGTVGNAVTAFTLARKKSLQGLQSTVHYHLGSLALSDLLTLLLAMPVELYNFIWVHHPWAFGDAGCRGYYFLRDACTYATALNVASLSVERYLAICHPFKAKTLMSRSRTKRFISAIWLAAGLLALPMLFTMGQQNRSADGQHPGGLVCTPVVSTATIKVVIQVRAPVGAEGWEEEESRLGPRLAGAPRENCFSTKVVSHHVSFGYRELEKRHPDVLFLGGSVPPSHRLSPQACWVSVPLSRPSFCQGGRASAHDLPGGQGWASGVPGVPETPVCDGPGLFLETFPLISFSKGSVSPKGWVCVLCSRHPQAAPRCVLAAPPGPPVGHV